MICSSEKRFFTSNLLGLGNWTPSRCATQTWGDVDDEIALFVGIFGAKPQLGAAWRIADQVDHPAFTKLSPEPDCLGRCFLWPPLY
ncbi:hypothetical protein BVV20_06750 [Xanthomonas oryzae pv. oryzae]|nr:hypothetical protein BVV20_06750 [Xanthomonas oryzae pv. oryzae]